MKIPAHILNAITPSKTALVGVGALAVLGALAGCDAKEVEAQAEPPTTAAEAEAADAEEKELETPRPSTEPAPVAEITTPVPSPFLKGSEPTSPGGNVQVANDPTTSPNPPTQPVNNTSDPDNGVVGVFGDPPGVVQPQPQPINNGGWGGNKHPDWAAACGRG